MTAQASKGRGRVAPSLPAIPGELLSWLAGELGPDERLALREIAERADILRVAGQAFLLAPVSPRTLDVLAAFEAEGEDREPGADDEPSILTYGDLEGDGP